MAGIFKEALNDGEVPIKDLIFEASARKEGLTSKEVDPGDARVPNDFNTGDSTREEASTSTEVDVGNFQARCTDTTHRPTIHQKHILCICIAPATSRNLRQIFTQQYHCALSPTIFSFFSMILFILCVDLHLDYHFPVSTW
jgi:hypothetical protein